MSDSYDDYESKMQLAEHAWEERVVKTEHDKQIKIAQAYERGWNAALAQREWVPEALRLAGHLENFRSFPDDIKAAAELRRLHEINQDLLALAERIARLPEHGHYLALIDEARAAIAKATGEKS